MSRCERAYSMPPTHRYITKGQRDDLPNHVMTTITISISY